MAMSNKAESSIFDRVVAYMNNELLQNEDCYELIEQNYEAIAEEYKSLEHQLSLASSQAPGKIQQALNEAESSASKVRQFSLEQEQLHGDICNYEVDSTSVTKKLVKLTDQIEELKVYSTYLQWLASIDDLSADIQSALIVDSQERAVDQFKQLTELACNIQTSRCGHLVQFANASVLFWYEILKDKLTSEFEEVLQAWGWPFIMSTTKLKKVKNPQQNEADIKKKLDKVFVYLLQLQLPEGLCADSQSVQKYCANLPGWRPLLLPIHIMLLPLRKRFKFHFFGKSQTNTIDKPEWYFTHTLTWIRDHRGFLENKIQPILDTAGKRGVIAVVEFCRGLVALVMEKMQSDLTKIMYDDQLFCHLVDEALAFDHELRDLYAYPPAQPSCLVVITQPEPFHKWLHMENKNATDKMDMMLSSPSAWQSQYKDVAIPEAGPDPNDLHVPECAEAFVTLMTTILERYRRLPSVEHHAKFVSLQIALLNEFRERLVQVQQGMHNPLHPTYIAILNATTYVLHMINEWTELPFFVQLHYWKIRIREETFKKNILEEDSIEDDPTENQANQENEDSSGSENKSKPELMTAEEDEDDLKGIKGSLFDDVREFMELLQNQMLDNIVHYVADDVQARTRPYRKDKWLSVQSHKEQISLSLSSTACEMLLVLREHLQNVREALTSQLFTAFWHKLAMLLDKFVYHEVILTNHFSEGGAAQLNYDMTRNLFPLFGQYTAHPENYFKTVKEALILLTLSAGNAMLLKKVIYDALHSTSREGTSRSLADPVAALHELKVYKLDLEQAELVLSLRVDVTAT